MPMNPHPFLTGFPTASALFCVVYELVSMRAPAFENSHVRNLLNSILFTVVSLTYFSGFYGRDAANASAEMADVIATHEGFARMALILSFAQIFLLIARNFAAAKSQRTVLLLFRVNLLLLASLLTYTSFLGGNLVFEHGIGVTR